MKLIRIALAVSMALALASGCAARGSDVGSGAGSPDASKGSGGSPAAPGSGASGGGETRTYECPALLTEAEIAKATGASGLTLQPPTGQSLAGATYCVYATPANDIRVNVNIWTGVGFAEMYPRLENTANLQNAPHPPGVGDDARWVAALGMLIARAGDKGVQISTPLGAEKIGDPQVSSVAIAKIVLPRL